MVNGQGLNQHAPQIYPSQGDLYNSLMAYATQKMTLSDQLIALSEDHGLCIGRDTLINIRCGRTDHLPPGLSIPSSRRPNVTVEAARATMLATDAVESVGPRAMHDILRIQHQVYLPRDSVREILLEERPLLFDIRQPGYREKLPRKRLYADGVGHQLSMDAHLKTGQMAMDKLGLGPVGMDVYGIRDKWCGAQLIFQVSPNTNDKNEVAHCYLDTVQFIFQNRVPLQLWADYGHETAVAFDLHRQLRLAALPTLPADEIDFTVQTYSVHNTPSEANWRQFRKQHGLHFKSIISQGVTHNHYDPSSPVHVCLFRWLWPQILQDQANQFVEYWNNHSIRWQDEKLMPSGHVPATAFQRPYLFGGSNLLFPVDPDLVENVRQRLPPRLTWVSENFEQAAARAYQFIGSPPLTAKTGWYIFARMLECLKDRFM